MLNNKTIHLSLDHITQAAKRLNLLAPKATVITIGGTNGKGSTLVALEQLCLKANYKIGTFTSPYFESPAETIRINGQQISEQQLTAAETDILNTCKDIPLTEYETLTLCALLLFKQIELDFIILEVCMGGRDDAVNIIDADLAIITNVSLDHCDYLGNTREEIGAIKSGIFRQNQTVIIGEKNPPQSVLEHANHLNIKPKLLDRNFNFSHTPCDNISTAVMAAKHLKIPITTLPSINLPGRFQVVTTPCLQIFDVAHNPAATKRLAKQLNNFKKDREISAVFSMFGNKDIANTIKPLKYLIRDWHIAELEHPRAAGLIQLETAFQQNKLTNYTAYSDIHTAYHAAIKNTKDDIVLVFGSFQTCKLA